MNNSEIKKKLQELSEQTDAEDLISMPWSFARELLKQTIYNPNGTSARNSITYSVYTKENIEQWLQNPSNNEQQLRNASNYLYLCSMHYQRLINYYANLLSWVYVVSPLNFDKSKLSDKKKQETFKKQYLKVMDSLELMNIPETMRNIMTVVLRDGIYYGVRWSDNNSSFVQKINADYCRVTSMTDGIFLYSVDMSKISKDKLAYYPEVFTTMYNEYKKTGIKYQEVPPEISVCIKADATIVDYSVPPFAAVLPELYRIANVSSLQETSEELNNYKMITGKVPISNDGQPLIPWDLVMKYYQNIKNALGDGVGLAVSPFDLKSFDFESSGTIAEVDNVNRAISNFWATAGTSGLLHGVANNTAGVTKLAIKNDENYIFGIMKQAERWFNYYLKTSFSGATKFKLTFLPITIYNREDYIKMYKEAVPFGIGKTYYIASLGIPQHDVEGLCYLEDDVLAYSEILTPMLNSHNATTEELGAGRQELKVEDLSEAGANTRDNDSNSNR